MKTTHQALVPRSPLWRRATAGAALLAGLLAAQPGHAAAVIGAQLYSTGGDVTVEVQPATAGYVSELHLFSPSPARFIALNTEVGTTVNLGSFPAGTELIFGIYVRDTGDTFLMGPATRNADGLAHAGVDFQGPGLAIVGFEDLLGGGDLDYDDNVFKFTGGIAPLVCPSDIVTGNGLGQCSAVVNYTATAPDGATLVCTPASGSTFPVGTTTVTCTATYLSGLIANCSFTITVEDREAPLALCAPGVNPSGKKVPTAGKNPRSGENPDGFYQVGAADNCDSSPQIYIKDSASSFIAGPFHAGDNVKITQAPGAKPSQKPMAGAVLAHIKLKGDALLYAVDASGNISTPLVCHVPPLRK